MLSQINIENFKCFKKLRLPMSQLTVLTGFNAGGKSTALQALLLIAQSLREANSLATLPLNGPFVRLGNPGDILCRNAEDSRTVRFGFESGAAALNWEFEASSERRGFLKNVDGHKKFDGGEAKLADRIRSTTFLSAMRLAQVDVWPVPSDSKRVDWDVGSDGQYGAFILESFSTDVVPEGRRCPGETSETVHGQVDAWLNQLFPGARSNATALDGVELMRLEFRSSRGLGWVKPNNIGYGLSYIFPLLVALMKCPDDHIFVVDSPEAHLHPSAQSLVGQLIAQVAGAGVQIIVETHSDHLLNGIRLGVRYQKIEHNDVHIHFFTGPEKDYQVNTMHLDKNGAVSDWPAGFFDQAELDLFQLIART